MKPFDFIVIGGGIAGLLASYFLKEFNTLLIDEDGILTSGASAAAGAFLFPKVGFDTKYTRFINNAILEAFEFYESLNIPTYKEGVTILPRDERDIEKFKKYEKDIKLPFEKRFGGFFFKDGGVVNPQEVKEKIKVDYEVLKVEKIFQDNGFWVVNERFIAKNIILTTGHKSLIDIPYISIRPIWGERIEGEASLNLPCHFHKNCSLSKIGNIVKIGATHKRNCLECKENEEEVKELLKKANEITEIKDFKLSKILGGFRAASVDYFPVVGNVIDVNETLKTNPKVVKGEVPKSFSYVKGLYIINGMGGRGFSNALVCARALKEYIVNNKDLGVIDTKRLFIKWARKEGEKYLLV